MGCDIHGVIEVRSDDEFEACALIDFAVGQDYGVFALLFGVRLYVLEFDDDELAWDELPPFVVAYKRGIPEDCDVLTKALYDRWVPNAHSASYIYWQEIAEAQWDVEREPYRPVQHHDTEGNPIVDFPATLAHSDMPNIWKHHVQTVRNFVHQSFGWQLIFDAMERLSRQYGDENVRLVVWFDN